eukprot:NODE_511_length_7387_cov_0.329857.p1 type:complete len:850 gc:universal NODE_511_length_7387_cov_0.329857:6807-4258(-)
MGCFMIQSRREHPGIIVAAILPYLSEITNHKFCMKQNHSLLKLLEVADVNIFLYQINKNPSPILVDLLNKRLEIQNSKEFDSITLEKLELFSLQLTLIPVSFDQIIYKSILKLFCIKESQYSRFENISWTEMLQIFPVYELHSNVALLLNTHLYPNPSCHESINIYCCMPFMMLAPLNIQSHFNFPKLLENKQFIPLQYHKLEQKYKLALDNTQQDPNSVNKSKYKFLHYCLQFTDSIYNSLAYFSNIPSMIDVVDMQLYFLQQSLEFQCLSSPFHVNTHLSFLEYYNHNAPSEASIYVIINCSPSNEFMSSAHEKPYVVYYECIDLIDLDLYHEINNALKNREEKLQSSQDILSLVKTATHLYRESQQSHQSKIMDNLSKTIYQWKTDWNKRLEFINLNESDDLSDFKVKNKKKTSQFKSHLHHIPSPYSHISSFHIIPMLHKPGDLRIEKFALQLLKCLQDIFRQEHVGDTLLKGGLASGLTIYEILCASGKAKVPIWLNQHPDLFDDDLESFGNNRQHGMIELCVDTISIHKITQQHGSFKQGFQDLYGKSISGPHYNFLFSLVAYSIATWLFNIKDRHNSNLLMHIPTGKLIHIDFGFFFNLIPGNRGIGGLMSGGSGFEQAPFKLASDYIEVLGGIPKELKKETLIMDENIVEDYSKLSSASREYLNKSKLMGTTLWNDFNSLMFNGFKAVKKHHRKLIDLVSIMETAENPLPCFTGKLDVVDEVAKSPLVSNRFSPELQRSNSVPIGMHLNSEHHRYVSSPILNDNRTERESARSSTTRPSSRASSVKLNTNIPVTDGLRERCFVNLTDEKLMEQVNNLIDNSIENVFTILYDQYQRITNGIL